MGHLSVGRLRHRAALQRPVETPDGTGGVLRVYETAAHLWCSLQAAGPRDDEDERAERRELAALHRAEMRWRADIDGTCRLLIGERIFSVRSVVDPDGRRRRLVCSLREVTP